jgi:hypothetical protein
MGREQYLTVLSDLRDSLIADIQIDRMTGDLSDSEADRQIDEIWKILG